MAKMHPNAVDMTLALSTSYVHDARTHACQWDCNTRAPGFAFVAAASWVNILIYMY